MRDWLIDPSLVLMLAAAQAASAQQRQALADDFKPCSANIVGRLRQKE
jgi:hypothetical protein